MTLACSSIRHIRPESTTTHHGHARRHPQHQRSRARARAERPHVRVRGRIAADAGAGVGDLVRRAGAGRQADDGAAARGVRVARLRHAAARSGELRHRPDPQGIRRPQDRADAARSAAVQAQQQALLRHFRSRQPAGAGGGALQDQSRARADRRRGRQARPGDREDRRGERHDAQGHGQSRGHGDRPRGRLTRSLRSKTTRTSRMRRSSSTSRSC